MLEFSSPEVGSPGSVMSFLNIVETWSGKGTLGADLHASHLVGVSLEGSRWAFTLLNPVRQGFSTCGS